MKIAFRGAAGEVTGSMYLVETRSARVLVDCGMFQGHGASHEKNSDMTSVEPRRLDAVVLTHAHLDHCGRLPLLTRGGFRKAIYCTAATADFTQLVLSDSAHLQKADAERASRHRRDDAPVEPLYTHEDVERVVGRFRTVKYGESTPIAEGISARLVDAGHLLGSASVELSVEENGTTRTVVFSGDIGSLETPYLRDPTPFTQADLVVMESTYGDRDHRPKSSTIDEFAAVLKDAAGSRERVLIPAFAIGRTQQVLYHIAQFIHEGKIPPIDIYLDSPMAIEATNMYRRYRDLFDEEATRLTKSHQLEHDLQTLHFTKTAEESKALNNLRDAAVIIAASGMCEGGRIVHHLRHNLARPYVHVAFVGYQAEGTLGSRLIGGAKTVRILGDTIPVAARIHTLGGFSGHAGQTELLGWFGHVAGCRPRVVLTHGEDRQREALAAEIKNRHGLVAARPMFGDVITL